MINRFNDIWRKEEGVAAIEFAFLAMPLIILLFAIFEIGMYIWAGSILDNVALQAARQVEIGCFKANCEQVNQDDDEITYTGITPDYVREFITRETSGIIDGEATTGGEERLCIAISAHPDPNSRDYEQFNLGQSGDIIHVFVRYRWPIWGPTSIILESFGLRDEYMTMKSSYVVRNEDFGISTNNSLLSNRLGSGNDGKNDADLCGFGELVQR